MSSKMELSLVISELDFGFGNKPCMLLFVHMSFFLAKKNMDYNEGRKNNSLLE